MSNTNHSFLSFSHWVEEATGIPEQFQLLLTSRGILLKFETIVDGQEVYLYDKSLMDEEVNSSISTSSSTLSLPQLPPDTSSISDTFNNHSNWTSQCLELANTCISNQQEDKTSVVVIKKGLAVAIDYLMKQSLILQKLFESTVDKAIDFEKNIPNIEEVDIQLKNLEQIKIIKEFKNNPSTDDVYLSSLVNKQSIYNSIAKLNTTKVEIDLQISHFINEVNNLIDNSKILKSKCLQFTSSEEGIPSSSASVNQLLDELKILSNKIHADSQSILTLPEQTRLRIGNLHKRNLIPQIASIISELIKITNQWSEVKCNTSQLSQKYLITLSQIQGKKSIIRIELTNLTKLLDSALPLKTSVLQVVELPFFYGALIIESIRRNEFSNTLKNTIAETAESLAGKRLTEQANRTKWINYYKQSYPNFISLLNGEVGEFEINFSSKDDDILIDVTKPVFNKYIENLKSVGLDEVGEELREEYRAMKSKGEGITTTTALTELPNKLFKSGNLTEAFSQERNDLYNKISGYEGRIRILEDLLHKQQFKEEIAAHSNKSPNPSSTSPNPSSPSPRLIERIHMLELQKTKLEEENASLKESLELSQQTVATTQQSLNDALNVKSDLLANMTSQEKEFSTERTSYTDEINELKNRIDSLESELDRNDQQVQLENDQLQQTIATANTKLNTLDKDNHYLLTRTRDLSQKLFTAYKRSCEALESMGLQQSKQKMEGNSIKFNINRVRGLRKSKTDVEDPQDSQLLTSEEAHTNTNAHTTPSDVKLLYWMDSSPNDIDEKYQEFINEIYIDYDLFRDSISKRFRDLERYAHKILKDLKQVRDSKDQAEKEIRQQIQSRLAVNAFKVGDLGLFLPTKDATRVPNLYAAFNLNAPHYFLNENVSKQLANRDYVVARITNIEDRIVNKAEESEQDNPFDLSDGLHWHLIDAIPEW